MKKVTLILVAGIVVCTTAIVSTFSFRKSNSNLPNKKELILKSERPDLYVDYHNEIRTKAGEEYPTYENNYQFEELQKALLASKDSKVKSITWQERGPANVPGRTRAIIVDPDDPTQNTWFAGATSGGVWKTTDAGTNWEYISDEFPNLAVSTMAMANSNTDVIYAGTGERGLSGLSSVNGGGILKTTNKGDTWVLLDNSTDPDIRTINRILVDPNDENTVLACVVSANYHYLNQNGDPITSSIIKSTDGGTTWAIKHQREITFSDTGEIQHLIADPLDFNNLYASVMGKGVMKSTDKGETWVLYNNGFTGNYERIELAIANNNTDILYASVDGDASGNNSDLYITEDAGINWQLVLEEGGGENPNWLIYQGWYDNTILVHPYEDSIVYVGGINLWRITLDNIGTANDVERTTEHMTDAYYYFDGKNENVHVDHHNITAIEGTNDEFRLLNGNDGGLFLSDLSTDPGFANNTWGSVGMGYNTSQFYGVDKAHGVNMFIGGTQDNGTWLSPDPDPNASSEYEHVLGGDGFEALWHYDNPDYIMASSQFNGIVRTTDGGQSGGDAVQGLVGNGPFVTRLGYSRSDPDIVYAVTDMGVARSDDFGGLWQMSYINISEWGFWNGTDVEVSKANPQMVMSGGSMSDEGSLFVSTDGGLSFETTNNFDNIGRVTGIASHPTSETTFFATFAVHNEAKILRTTDLGQTWEDISGFDASSTSSGFPNAAVYDVLVMPYNTDIIWAGTEIGIFESIDNGQTWSLIAGDFPPVSVWEMKIIDGMVVISTFGRGIWTATMPELTGYEYPDIVRVPRINSLTQQIGQTTKIAAEFELRDIYDSTQVYLNDVYQYTIPANTSTAILEEILETGLMDSISMQLISYSEGVDYKSGPKSIYLIEFSEAVNHYENDFNSPTTDFVGSGFEVKLETGFTSEAIHSVHPYTDNTNNTYMLTVPIILSEDVTKIIYKDVAIVEPGDPGSVYGDENFWDYVVVEGSKDGTNWTEIADGYDAKSNTQWLNTYNSGGAGTDAMYIQQEFDLHNAFNTGDTIILRFRLYTDAAVTGWGWAIDDLEIINSAENINKTNISSANINIFPNPSNGIFKLKLYDELEGTIDIDIYDISGKLVYRKSVSKNNDVVTLKIDISAKPSGVYIARISDGKHRLSKKIKIVK